MTARMPDAVKSYKVVCVGFVSVSFSSEAEAQRHLKQCIVGRCREIHSVEFTDMPYGTRVRQANA